MSDTHQWDVQISIGDVIGIIRRAPEEPGSFFDPGPFPPGYWPVMMLVVENIGDTDGTIYWRLFEYPNTAQELEVDSGSIFCNWGEYQIVGNRSLTLPAVSSYPLGVKVWGETESEPAWGAMGTFMWNNPEFTIIF